MNIYIDFDDCLCETARFFTGFVKKYFHKNIPYEDMHSFDLQESFRMTDEQYKDMMIRAHSPERLLALEETPGASKIINGWMDRGHRIFVITGRPSSAYGPSRKWLDGHGLDRAELFCLNKYGRDTLLKESTFTLEPEEYRAMKFDLAVEDSPMAFKYFTHLPELRVCVFDRPWNRKCAFPGPDYHRCVNWEEIDAELKKDIKY